MITFEFNSSEVYQLIWLIEKRFEVVWSRYCRMVSLREYTDAETLACFREDVLEIVSLLRKLKSASC